MFYGTELEEADLNQEKVEPVKSNSNLKSYFCLYCHEFLMKGTVKRLKMNCPHCQKLIDADGDDLFVSNGPTEELD